MPEDNTFEPDWEIPCGNCGATPTVEAHGENSGLCGSCYFGDADCIDPDEW